MKYHRHVMQDLLAIVASIAFSVVIVQYSLVEVALAASGGGTIIASFVAGMFFTSVLTTAPAIAVLGELSLKGNFLLVALIGGAGAVVGDYFLFAFVRDRISGDVAHLLKRRALGRLHAVFRLPTFKWLLPFLGGLIIASPLPDEIGLALLGFARLTTRIFIPLSFAFNAFGIILISLVARSF